MRPLTFICLGLMFALPEPAAAASDLSTLESYARARAIVARGIQAVGGEKALSAAGSLLLEAEGTVNPTAQDQGQSPASPAVVPIAETLVIDRSNGRVGFETDHKRLDETKEWLRFVHGPGDSFQFAQLGDGFGVITKNPTSRDTQARLERMVPHLLLESAVKNAASLRYLGKARQGNQTVEMVSFAVETGETLTLRFGGKSGLLLGFEYLVDMPLHGDTSIRWQYADYREVPSLGMHPSGYTIWIGEQPWKEMRFKEIRTSNVDLSPVFTIPEGFRVARSPPPPPNQVNAPPQPTVTEVAPGVHFVQGIRGGFHVMFVEFKDFVVALEAPTGWLELHLAPASDFTPGATSSSVSEEFIQIIRQKVPSKPIRFVVLSHFHSDHAGGVRAFVAEGATVLTTQVATGAIQRALERPHTLNADPLTKRPRESEIRAVSKRQVISDGTQEIELIEMESDNPHAAGMLIMNFPRHNFLYVSDLFPPWRRQPSPSHLSTMRYFVAWLDQHGLKPEKIYASHGAGIGSHEQLEQIRAVKPEPGERKGKHF